MENKKEENSMPKWLIYTLFILKFLLGIALIWWTVYMTLGSDVGKDDDNAFLSNYHTIDKDFNKIARSNVEFTSKYNLKIVINNEEIMGLTYDDIYLSQRIIKDRKIRKNMLNVGNNTMSIYIQDKNGNNIEQNKIDILVTKNNTHEEDVTLAFINETTKKFDVSSRGYWNITGTIEVNGSKGYFYLKTNASKNKSSQ